MNRSSIETVTAAETSSRDLDHYRVGNTAVQLNTKVKPNNATYGQATGIEINSLAFVNGVSEAEYCIECPIISIRTFTRQKIEIQ